MTNKRIWSGLFTYSLTERKGYFLFFLLVFILKFTPIVLHWYNTTDAIPPEIVAAFQVQIDSIHVDSPQAPKPDPVSKKTTKSNIQIEFFDPNTVSETLLRSWRLPEYLIKNWLNYRKSGGQFKSAEDLKKLYSMKEDIYIQLQGFVRISNRQKELPASAQQPADSSQNQLAPSPEVVQEVIAPPVSIDINQSREEDWIRLPGIGPTYASRIIRFREALGGFAGVDQISETWNIPDSVFQLIKPLLKPSPIYRSIKINEQQEETLAAHPYLNNKQAKIIARYRVNYGPFPNIESLRNVGVLSEADISRLAPYLIF
ncbi:MAG: helix-hairpin-helix domain-containing protein [Saprospiraceae bacterium]|nr:helix-hairpin-helix domain-containing protein [Saprospiraceae bacterium]